MVRHWCAIGAPSVRHWCAIGAPLVHHWCAIGAPSVRNGCVMGVTWVRRFSWHGLGCARVGAHVGVVVSSHVCSWEGRVCRPPLPTFAYHRRMLASVHRVPARAWIRGACSGIARSRGVPPCRVCQRGSMCTMPCSRDDGSRPLVLAVHMRVMNGEVCQSHSMRPPSRAIVLDSMGVVAVTCVHVAFPRTCLVMTLGARHVVRC